MSDHRLAVFPLNTDLFSSALLPCSSSEEYRYSRLEISFPVADFCQWYGWPLRILVVNSGFTVDHASITVVNRNVESVLMLRFASQRLMGAEYVGFLLTVKDKNELCCNAKKIFSLATRFVLVRLPLVLSSVVVCPYFELRTVFNILTWILLMRSVCLVY